MLHSTMYFWQLYSESLIDFATQYDSKSPFLEDISMNTLSFR